MSNIIVMLFSWIPLMTKITIDHCNNGKYGYFGHIYNGHWQNQHGLNGYPEPQNTRSVMLE